MTKLQDLRSKLRTFAAVCTDSRCVGTCSYFNETLKELEKETRKEYDEL